MCAHYCRKQNTEQCGKILFFDSGPWHSLRRIDIFNFAAELHNEKFEKVKNV